MLPVPHSPPVTGLLILSALLLLGVASANSEAVALLEIRDGFANGPTVLSSWGNASSNPCGPPAWDASRVVCNNNTKMVIQLWLDNLGLNGTIPLAGWDQLTSLQLLSLATNLLSGSISPAWRLPDSLQGLGLSNNTLSGSLSANWRLPTSLQQLIINFNRINGSVSTAWVASLPTSLKQLELQGNLLSGTLPPDMRLPVGMDILNLEANRLEGTIPQAFVANLPATLKTLSLAANNLKGPLPPDWSAALSLGKLSLAANHLSGALSHDLRLPDSLLYFYMNGNEFTSSIPPDWALPKGLLELALQNNSLTGTLPAAVLPQTLTGINLGGNQFRGAVDWTAWPPKLATLKLSNNSLTGTLPSSLPTSLRYLELGSNLLRGSIPPNMTLPQGMITLMLYNNSLSGTLPPALQLPQTLLYLNLNQNKLSGPLPNWTLPQGMLTFALSNNTLTGTIPYQQLPGSMVFIDLSFNSLQGTLPASNWSLPNLLLASFYYNRLTGSLPVWQANPYARIQILPQSSPAGFCGQVPSQPQYVVFSPSSASWVNMTSADLSSSCQQSSTSGGGSSTAAIAAGVAAGVVGIAVVVLGLLFIRRRKRRRAAAADIESNGSKLTADGSMSQDDSLNNDKLLKLALKSARSGGTTASAQSTSMFMDLKIFLIDFQTLDLVKQIGEGSFGRVYLARWQHTPVACKVLMNTSGSDESGEDTLQRALTLSNPVLENLQKEAGLMAAMRHPNIVGFLGVCPAPPCVVTEFCSRGSLTDVLRQARQSPSAASKLDWPRRLGMVLDTAKGMLYLHSHNPPIIHRDLKSPNLLVDTHWRVKVSDFNLSKILEDTVVLSSAQATNPRWLAPEVLEGQPATLAADVFAFGVVLWEMLTWEVPFSQDNHWQLVKFVASGGRPNIPERGQLPGPSSGAFEGLDDYVTLMKRCWAQAPEERPTFHDIVTVVKNLLTRALRTVGAAPSPLAGSHRQSMSPAGSGVPADLQPGASRAAQGLDAPGRRDSEDMPTVISGGTPPVLSGESATPTVASGASPTGTAPTTSQPTTDSCSAPSPITPL